MYPSRARRLRVVGSDAYYLIPGRRWMCLMDQNGTGGCNYSRRAVEGYLWGVVADPEQETPRRFRAYGVLPDGSSRVRVHLRGGGSVADGLRRNFWLVDVHRSPTRYTWRRGGKRHSIPLLTGLDEDPAAAG